MITPRPDDALHKAWLFRLLMSIADHHTLPHQLRFKGGTCAALRGVIDRFSVDLDFDLILGEQTSLAEFQKYLEKVFFDLGLTIANHSQRTPQYFLKYPSPEGKRNSMKLDILNIPPVSNLYEAVRFPEIDRVMLCQTVPTMMANKLVAVLDRYDQHGGFAGRDIYDIHQYFLKGYQYHAAIIQERRNGTVLEFFKELRGFIEKRISQQILDEDLNLLLAPEEFSRIRKTLKQEVLIVLDDELKRLV